MAITPKMGLTEADGYFAVDDPVIQDAIRQIADNLRDLRKEVIALEKRVSILENEKDTDLL
tara:strand:- start:233 stop:415 length:183 start_codon:yes stop_codon:yes gene_type:complete